MHASGLVEQRDRLGAHALAARRMHQLSAMSDISAVSTRRTMSPPWFGLAISATGLEGLVSLGDATRPVAGWRTLDERSGGSRRTAWPHRRPRRRCAAFPPWPRLVIDSATTTRLSGGAVRTRAASIQSRWKIAPSTSSTIPSRVQLLPPEPRAEAVARHQLLHDARRQIQAVDTRGAARDNGARRRDQRLQRRDVARRGGDGETRPRSDTQRHAACRARAAAPAICRTRRPMPRRTGGRGCRPAPPRSAPSRARCRARAAMVGWLVFCWRPRSAIRIRRHHYRAVAGRSG